MNPTWCTWQLSVPTTGLMHSDQRQPGSIVNRAAVVSPPIRTTSTLVLSGERTSSGASKSPTSRPTIKTTPLTTRLTGWSRACRGYRVRITPATRLSRSHERKARPNDEPGTWAGGGRRHERDAHRVGRLGHDDAERRRTGGQRRR